MCGEFESRCTSSGSNSQQKKVEEVIVGNGKAIKILRDLITQYRLFPSMANKVRGFTCFSFFTGYYYYYYYYYYPFLLFFLFFVALSCQQVCCSMVHLGLERYF